MVSPSLGISDAFWNISDNRLGLLCNSLRSISFLFDGKRVLKALHDSVQATRGFIWEKKVTITIYGNEIIKKQHENKNFSTAMHVWNNM